MRQPSQAFSSQREAPYEFYGGHLYPSPHEPTTEPTCGFCFSSGNWRQWAREHIRIASREIILMGKMLASSLLLCLSPSHPMPVPMSGLLKTPDQRTLLASAGMISHEASGKACGHRGGLIIRAIAPPLSSLALTPAGRHRPPPRIWSPSERRPALSKDAASASRHW
jgi:hypothetical protein